MMGWTAVLEWKSTQTVRLNRYCLQTVMILQFMYCEILCYHLSLKPLVFLLNLMFVKFHHLGLTVQLAPCDMVERTSVKKCKSCFLQHSSSTGPMASVRFSRAKWKWAVNLQMWENCSRICPYFFPPSCGGAQSVHLWASVWVFYCLGKTLSVLHAKPSPSPSLSIFPSLPSSLQQLFSCLSWELEPGCFSPILASQAGTHRLTTYTDTQSFCLSLPCPTLVWLLTVYWPHFGLQTEKQVFPLFYLAAVIACSHCCVRAAWLFGEMLSW